MHEMKPNWPLLSLVRFALALIVFQAHSGAFFDDVPGIGNWGPVGAVIAFFLISGFSIAHSLERDSNAPRFYGRRLRRIMPEVVAGWMITVAAFAYAGVVIQAGKSSYELPANLAEMLRHLFPGWSWAFASPEWNPALWSLGIEFLYYVFAPLLLRLSERALLAVTGVSFALFAGAVVTGQSLSVNGLLCPYLYFWVWMLGYLWAKYPTPRLQKIVLVGIPAAWVWGGDATGHPNNAALLIACCLVVYQHEVKIPARWSGAATWLGNASYTIYALHYPLWIALFAVTAPGSILRLWWAGVPLVFAAALGLCALIDLRRNPARRANETGHTGLSLHPASARD